jgi:outer membrane protein, heavy metal efflux system
MPTVFLSAQAKEVAILEPVSITPRNSGGTDEARSIILTQGKLTLEAYLHAVDFNFPGLSSAVDQQRIASADRLAVQGVFDPLLTDESGYTRMQNTSKIGDAKNVLFNYPKIELPFRSGIRAFAQFRYNPNSAQSPYVETGEGGEYSAGVLIPLLRGLIYNEQSVAEKEAKFSEQLATQTFFLKRLDTLLRAGSVYWSWVGAKQKAAVAKQIFNLANTIANISQQQERNGDLARIYVTEAEEDVQRRDADLTQSQRDFQRYSFNLSAVLFDMGGTPLPLPSEINVPEIPKPKLISESDTDRSLAFALNSRPELKAIDIQRKITEVQLKLAKNQMLPALNAVATQGYDTGHNSIGYVYRGQLTFSQSLLLRTAKGKLAAAKLRLDKLEKDRQAEEQRIRNEVFDAISAINLAYKRFVSLELQVNKAEQVYQGERERFSVGDSTVYFMAERERQLNEAKFRMIDAEVEYHVGVLSLKAITSQL